MTEEVIKKKLDTLAEFYSQKDALELSKRELLDTVFTAEIKNAMAEIETEFAGKSEDVLENIKKLEAEIKADVKATGASVKGNYFHAVYVKGRVTWNTDKMDAWLIDHPFLKDARKEGEPSITLRKV